MRFFILFAILCSMVVAKYSYTDKCYCYEGRDGQYSRHVGLHSSKVDYQRISTMLTREQFLLEEIASFMPVDLMPICHQPFLCITSMEILILHQTAMCSVTAHDWVTATIVQTCVNPYGSRFGPTWTTRSSPIVRRSSRVSTEMSRSFMAH